MREVIQNWLKNNTPLKHDDELNINTVETYLKSENTTLSELEEDDLIWIMKLRLQYS